MATLLIVDDDNNIRETLRDLLGDVHECHTADRADQALSYLEFESYDVVLTDIAMPGLSGEELLKRVRVQHPHTPVIVISGNSDEDAAKQLLALGAFEYISKPFKLEDVESAVVRALARRNELKAKATEEPRTLA